MNFADFFLITLLLAVVLFAISAIRRNQGTCCGDCAKCAKKHSSNCK